MRAAVQSAVGEMKICEVDAPAAGPGELIVRVRAALTCGTDRKILDRGHEKLAPPLVMGHEFSGDVAEAGPGAPFRVGDAVMGGISGPCEECVECRSGASNRCASPKREMTWGAFAELVRVPARVAARNTFPKPESLEYESAAIVDPLACVARGVARLGPGALDDLLVVGAGAVGLLWTAVARSLGASKISVVGRGEERLEAARRLGARVFEPGSRPPPARTVVECVGTPEAWEESFSLAAAGGTVLFFGGCAPGSEVTLPAARLHYEEVTAAGSFHSRPEDVRQAVGWLVSGTVDPRPFFSESGSLSNLPGFFDRMRRGEGIKFVVKP
ncbi:MAG: zinc-dependent alcohol dehydrogenase [Thermoanaerobaculia bacterium]